MFVTYIFLTTLGFTLAGYSGSSSNNVGDGQSFGYGYSGSFSGNGGNGGEVPVPPIPQFDFGVLANYFDSLRKYHEQFLNTGGGYAYSYTSFSPNSNAQAQSSITFKKPYRYDNTHRIQQNVQQGAGAAGTGGSSYSNGGGTGFSGGFSDGGYSGGGGTGFTGTGGLDGKGGAAFASGSIGPEGGYQSAKVFPENPNSPNIETRFGADEGGAAGGNVGGGGGGGSGPGFYSVSTFSSSSTKNLNGKPETVQHASTTINDNGKVRTYTVKNP